MRTSTVNISFKKDLLEKIDTLALNESRSRSELIREAARLYIEKKQQWDSLFKFGATIAKTYNLKPSDIENEIQLYRQGH